MNNSVWPLRGQDFLLKILKLLDFVSDLATFQRIFCLFPPSGRTLGVRVQQPSAGHEEIGQSE